MCNMFYNNKQKLVNDAVVKDAISGFKKGREPKSNVNHCIVSDTPLNVDRYFFNFVFLTNCMWLLWALLHFFSATG